MGISEHIVYIFEPVHDKTYSTACATSKDSDQPADLCSLIRIFADCVCPLQPPGCPKRDKQEPFHESLLVTQV